jgi:formylglycine-generating enzyme required for sulfatase activity
MAIRKQTVANRVDERGKVTGFNVLRACFKILKQALKVSPLKQPRVAAIGGLVILLTIGGTLPSPLGASEDSQIPALMAKLERQVRPPASGPPAQPGASRENSLGMRFVPVPGTKVWFGIWDTRVRDYQAFVDATHREWQKPKSKFEQGPEHPAVLVSWDDAKAFCLWLTQRERAAGTLGDHQSYRLPTDEEWSVAVGLGPEAGGAPQAKSGKTPGVYPWGTHWPPPRDAGNYSESLHVDTFVYTSPVGSFRANQYGLYDMGGNVWQWCEDSYDPTHRVLRGASWFNYDPVNLLSSFRNPRAPDDCRNYVGFRCVLAGD